MLFDLGLYPAAIPADDSRVWGEVHQMLDFEVVLRRSTISRDSASTNRTPAYPRAGAPVTFEDGGVVWRGCTSTMRRGRRANGLFQAITATISDSVGLRSVHRGADRGEERFLCVFSSSSGSSSGSASD